MSDPDPYLLGYRLAEQQRLERQSDELAADSERLFDQIGVRRGSNVVEIGCGPRGCLGILSRRVGNDGKVVGVERNPQQVQSARRYVADNQLTNVEVVESDARSTTLPRGAFDLATARLVLVNIPNPEEVIAEMIRLVRPGGIIALHEPDSSTQRYDPPHSSQSRLLHLLNAYAELNGIDRSIGLRVPRMLRDSGLIDIQVTPIVHVYPVGHPRRMLPLEFVENARLRLLEKELIGEAELDELIATFKLHLENPSTVVVSSLFIQAWARIQEK